jgi:hypothetical protein
VTSVSVWEDFVDIFYTPRQVFERRKGAGFAVPLVVLILAIAVLYVVAKPVLQPMFDAEFARSTAIAMKQNPQAAAGLEQGREFFEKTQYFLVPFGTLLGVFAMAIVLWVVVKFFDLKLDFKSASLIATYSYFPRIVEQIAGLLQGFIMPSDMLDSRYSVTLGLGRFFDPDTVSPVLLAVFGRIDVFTIWVTVLIGIGIAVICGTDRKKAVMVGVTMWVLGTLPQLLSAIQTSNV